MASSSSSSPDPAERLSELADTPTGMSFQRTLAHVDAKISRRRTLRAVSYSSFAVASAVVVLAMTGLLGGSSADTPAVVSVPPAPSHAPVTGGATVAERTVPQVAPAVARPVAAGHRQPGRIVGIADPVPVPSSLGAAFIMPLDIAPELLRSLALSPATIRELQHVVGPREEIRLVSSSLADTEVCLQAVCEGGDRRNITCTAPLPFPSLITGSNGAALVTIRHDQDTREYVRPVALRVKVNGETLLVWYNDASDLARRIPQLRNEIERRTVCGVVRLHVDEDGRVQLPDGCTALTDLDGNTMGISGATPGLAIMTCAKSGRKLVHLDRR